jgi:hypothetical protein
MEKVWASLLLCAVALTFVPVGLAQDYTLQNLYREAVKNSEKIKYAGEGSFENLRQTALNDRTDLRSYDMQIQVAERQVNVRLKLDNLRAGLRAFTFPLEECI